MNKYKILPSSSFGFICRTCLLHKELFLIEEVSWEGVDLKEIIYNWTSLEVEKYDHLPRQMCSDCIKLMYRTYHFLSMCKRSERTLKDILLRDRIESEEVLEDHPDLITNLIYFGKKEVADEIYSDEDSSIQPECDNIDNSLPVSDNIENSSPEADINSIPPDSENLNTNSLPDSVVLDSGCLVTNDNDYDDKTQSEISSGEEEMLTECDPEETILHEIQSIKDDITKIRAHNERNLLQKMKAKLKNRDYLGSKSRSKGPPYKCATCEDLFQTQEELKSHVNDIHKKFFKFQCEHCDNKYQNLSQLVAHTRIHTGEKPYHCRICGDKFRFKSVLKRHMISHMETKPHRCRHCNKEFTRKHILDQHERKHTGERLFCRYCGTEFATPKRLTHHEKNCHPIPENVTTSVTVDGYQCNTCGKVLQSEKTLQAHVLLHGPRDYKCETCGKGFTTNERLQLHSKTTHETTMYVCHLCEKKYRQKSGLIGHLESQHESNIYCCEECGKKFVYKGSLREHMRVHRGDSKYQCKECQKVCINRRRLEGHMRTHTGEKPFTCEFCGKCFNEKSNFQNHQKIHSKDKIYACNVCEKIFLDFHSLKNHIHTHI